MLLAVLLPAAFAAAAVVLVTDGRERTGPAQASSPVALVRLAERPPAFESLGGGIRPATPLRISIPAARVDAAVRPVAARGEALEVPDVGTAGWYRGGPRPGERGRAIVIGHLDTRKGPGLFARVPDLPPGTLVSVTDRRGDVHRYRVVGGAQVPKRKFPAEYVYGPSNAPVLVLITCGGDYDPDTGYEDNVLLYARAA
jgi:hypothetical protein